MDTMKACYLEHDSDSSSVILSVHKMVHSMVYRRKLGSLKVNKLAKLMVLSMVRLMVFQLVQTMGERMDRWVLSLVNQKANKSDPHWDSL